MARIKTVPMTIPPRLELTLVTRDERRPDPPPIPIIRFRMRARGVDINVEGPAHDHHITNLINEAQNTLRIIGETERAQGQLADEQRIRLPKIDDVARYPGDPR